MRYSILLLFMFLEICLARPPSQSSDLHVNLSEKFLLPFGLAACLILFLVICTCCDRKTLLSNSKDMPLSQYGSPSTNSFSRPTEVIQFEPLPEIHSRLAISLRPPRPAYFANILTRGLPLQDWFEDPHSNFPRSQLQYLKELGTGWFGRVVEGEAHNILPDAQDDSSRVVVRILREDASPSDHMCFLHDAQMYRDLVHPNILQLFGHCLETDPFLIIMEFCPMDLKNYLILNRKNAEALMQQGILLSLTFSIASALEYMHERGYVHMDLAARNCLITADNQVKIGDYGTSIQTYKNDYYKLGDVALPLRWCSPESLTVLESAIELKELTREANIWSFGIVVWEILEFGTVPYPELSDDQVLQKVIVEKKYHLEQPKIYCSFKDHVYQVIKLCCQSPPNRPSIQKLVCYFNHLKETKDLSLDEMKFEERWNAIQPHRPANHDLHSFASNPASFQFESNFVVHGGAPMSASLQNLRGSLEDLGPIYPGDVTPSYSSICEDIMALRYDLARPPDDSLDSWNKNLDSLSSLDMQLSKSQQNVSEFLKLTLIEDSSDSETSHKELNDVAQHSTNSNIE